MSETMYYCGAESGLAGAWNGADPGLRLVSVSAKSTLWASIEGSVILLLCASSGFVMLLAFGGGCQPPGSRRRHR